MAALEIARALLEGWLPGGRAPACSLGSDARW